MMESDITVDILVFLGVGCLVGYALVALWLYLEDKRQESKRKGEAEMTKEQFYKTISKGEKTP